MKNLLSYKSVRSLQIAEKLINSDDYVLFTDIQSFNNCSNKTVYDDLSYLEDNYNHYLELDIIKNKVRSSKTSVYDLMLMKRKIFNDEIKVKLILNIFFEPYLDMIDYSIKLNYSDSHLRSQIKDVNHHLKSHKISITYNQNKKGYYIAAENPQVLLTYISELIKISDNEHFLPELSKKELDTFQHFVEAFAKFIPNLLFRELYQLAKIQKTLLSQQNREANYLNDTESTRLYMDDLQKTYSNYIDHFLKKSKLVLPEEQYRKLIDIFVVTSLKLKSIPTRIDNFLNRYDYFYDAFSKENTKMTKVFEDAIQDLHAQTDLNLESYKTELLFHIYTHITSLRFYKVCHIGVFSELGEGHINSFLLTLKKNFPIHHFSHFDENQRYDLVITTTDSVQRVNLNGNRYVKVADYITHQDINNIYQKIYLK